MVQPEIAEQISGLLTKWYSETHEIDEFRSGQFTQPLAEMLGRLFQGWAGSEIIKDRRKVLSVFAEVMKSTRPDTTVLASATLAKKNGTD